MITLQKEENEDGREDGGEKEVTVIFCEVPPQPLHSDPLTDNAHFRPQFSLVSRLCNSFKLVNV